MEYLGIQKAFLAIAYDNGLIHSEGDRRDVITEATGWLKKFEPAETLPAIDAWLLDLTDVQFEIVCCGDQEIAERTMVDAPPYTERLLSDYCDEVCL